MNSVRRTPFINITNLAQFQKRTVNPIPSSKGKGRKKTEGTKIHHSYPMLSDLQ